ncbi:uncharacterized protein LOC130697834 [Daphnia carinata]|uniref:uncharacterized protein LOC130697834 n=1 Tax=Daphnia carinata TaxID=120202 RepID=UPI002579B8A7|nr:uncharacterized protein LOC130697834 [Daphnia carinata]
MAFYLLNVLIFIIAYLSFVRPAAVHDNIALAWPQASKTTTVVTTTTKSTSLACATLVEPLATTACNRKKQLWGVFYTLVHDDTEQFHPVNPTHVFKVEPSVLPENYIMFPIGVQSSLNGDPIESAMRIADPFLFSSFISSLFSNLFPGPSATAYTSTVTSTVFTATSTYTLSAVSCVPVDLITCPSTPDAAIIDVTENPITEDPVTDVLITLI